MSKSKTRRPSRRTFATLLTGITASAPLLDGAAVPQEEAPPKKKEPPADLPPFGKTIDFRPQPIEMKVDPFPLSAVRLRPSPWKDAQTANYGYLKRLDPDRLLHTFRINAGVPSTAVPLDGWEKPDCELRGHFIGHYLSACALMYASTGDSDLKRRAASIVSGLAACQAKLTGGYLSAFPTEYFDRLNNLQKVWAPFYTIHKVMAGLLDVHEYCHNAQALQVLEGMAQWADTWTATLSEEHMQAVLNNEFGGMSEVLYNLASVTGKDHYVVVGDRFTKKRFFNPLALRRDELRGLHVNTHIPQVIGAARRYELSGDVRFHDVADFFWWEVTTARTYATGGTSNNEGWLVEPRRLGAELRKGVNTTECCCAYNMLKLTRHLYRWSADPRYFDYYERTMLNHRLAAINRQTGATQYYLSLAPAAWKTFNTEEASFWCCTGTGVEEFSKLADSIYFHDGTSLFVNLFIPSELEWQEKGVRIAQETRFPESGKTTIVFDPAKPTHMPVHIRIPFWVGVGASVKVNGHTVEVTPSPASYFTLARTWEKGDRVEIDLPMNLRIEAMPDEPGTQAFLYGPLLLAGKLGKADLDQPAVIGPEGPELAKHPLVVPPLHTNNRPLSDWLQPISGELLTFETKAQDQTITFVPLHRLFDERYAVYWQVS